MAQRAPAQIDDLIDYIKALIGFMNDMANKAHLHGNDWDRTVFIDALGVRTTNFSLSQQTVKELIQSGKDGANSYLSWFDNPGTTPTPKNYI